MSDFVERQLNDLPHNHSHSNFTDTCDHHIHQESQEESKIAPHSTPADRPAGGKIFEDSIPKQQPGIRVLLSTCSLFSLSVCVGRSVSVRSICSLSVLYLFSLCSLSVLPLFSLSSLSVLSLFSLCSLSVRSLGHRFHFVNLSSLSVGWSGLSL
jgi:hypothetical protein